MASTNTSTPLVWLITGTTSGFGRHFAELLLAQGHHVVATARTPEKLQDLAQQYPESCLTTRLDVTDAASVTAAVDAAIQRFGRIDVLINNAGYGMPTAIEEASEAEFMPLFETNVFGLLRVTKAVLPQLRQQKSGFIVNLSSIGGLIGSAGWGYYNATKFAVNGLSEALAAEVEPLGIKVIVVEPGPFRTEFLGRPVPPIGERIADYDGTAGKAREYFETQGGRQPGDPALAAQAIIDAVLAPEPPKHLLLGKIALTRFRKRLAEWTEELDTWETVTVETDSPAK